MFQEGKKIERNDFSMKRLKITRPTTYYDENIFQIDEELCELLKKRKEVTNNNPGYPPFEYIDRWAAKYGLYEDQLKSIFGLLLNDEVYRPIIEPKEFRKNLPIIKYVEEGNRIFSVIFISQYSNASVVSFNIDSRESYDLMERTKQHTHFELYISEEYYCRSISGGGMDSHMNYNFVVSPPLPDNLSGIDLIFKEYNHPFRDKPTGTEIIIHL